MTSKKNEMIFDIAVIGAGPVGIAFACGFANSNMKVVIVEKQTKQMLENPKIDGREIALTHHSVNILKELGVWRHIPAKLIAAIKEARVLNGSSKYFFLIFPMLFLLMWCYYIEQVSCNRVLSKYYDF